MHRVILHNGTNATLQIPVRRIDSRTGQPVETNVSVLPKTKTTVAALHVYVDRRPAGLQVVWQERDPEPAAAVEQPVATKSAAPIVAVETAAVPGGHTQSPHDDAAGNRKKGDKA